MLLKKIPVEIEERARKLAGVPPARG